MKNISKKAAVFALVAILALTYTPLIAAAQNDEAPTLISEAWNGSTRLRSGRNYVVTDNIRLTSSLTVPEGASIDIRRGGGIILDSGMTLMIRGEFTVRTGGLLNMSDAEVIVRRGARLNVNGVLEQAEGTTLTAAVGSHIGVHRRGRISSDGAVSIMQDAVINNNGTLRLSRAAEMTLTGTLINHIGATVINQGIISITSRGTISNSGSISTSRAGTVSNDGRINLHSGSTYVNSGTAENTARSEIIDNRRLLAIDSYKFTAALLEGEQRTEILGIDVSFWQDDINWERVAASGVKFAMLRAGRGHISDIRPMIEDTRFREYAEGALAAGIDIGVYFYSYARTPAQARLEAEFLVGIIRDFEITYPVVFDIEEPTIHERMNRTENTALVRAFFEVIKTYGYFPMLYSYKSFLEDRIERDVLETYAVWVAHWGVRATNYRHPFHIWQYTDKGRVPGIRGDVDLNTSYYDFAEILRRHGLNNLR
jgi:GH25 family lysozyme M1 (1,4-beta-N-acetylmuramidase)